MIQFEYFTGKMRPKIENPKAPMNLISGPIDGKAIANAPAQHTSTILKIKKRTRIKCQTNQNIQ